VPNPDAPPSAAETTLTYVLGYLLPFFLKGANGDAIMARSAALQLLDSYGATSAEDLVLAAQVIAFSFSTLDALQQAVADPEMSANTRLRHRGNANALHRAGEKCRKALAQTRSDAPVQVPDTNMQVATQRAREFIKQAMPSLAAHLDSPQPISRQQRRYLSRKAEESRAQADRLARKTARLASRSAAATDQVSP
jgi:hypothetical protein